MPNRRSINLTQYGISRFRYAELQAFCLQYPEWMDKLKYQTDSLKGQQLTGMPFVGGISDTTCSIAISRSELTKNCQIIERTLIEAISTIKDGHGKYLFPNDFSEVYDLMLLAVTNPEVTYTWLYTVKSILISRDVFYNLKRHFFYLLDKNKR